MAKPEVMIEACENVVARLAHALDEQAFTKTELDRAIQATLGEIGKPKRIWDTVLEVQLNGLLSGLGTPLANAASVVYKQIANPIIDLVESANPKSDKHWLDIIAGIQAQLQGFASDMVYFKSGWVNGYPLDINRSITEMARRFNISPTAARKKLTDQIIEERVALALQRDPTIDEQAVRATLQKNFKPSQEQLDEYVRESYDYMRGAIPGQAGEFVRIPTKLSVAIDEYGKARFRRYKLAMLASQKARQEAGNDNVKYKKLYDQYLQASMQHMQFGDDVKNLNPKLRTEAVKDSFAKMSDDLDAVFGKGLMPYKTVKEYALREMFQQRLTGFPKWVQESRQQYPVVHLAVPFLKTPWNITKEGFSYVPVIPQVLKKYLGPQYKPQSVDALLKDIPPVLDPNKLGAYYELTNEEMLARQMMATGLFTAVMGMTQEGNVTGKPRDAAEAQAWKDAGIPQSSIKLGDTWYSYERIEPIATVLGISAEIARSWDEWTEKNPADKDEDWATDFGKAALFTLKANIVQKSFVEGFSGVIDDFSQGVRTGSLEPVASAVGRQFIPAFINQIARVADPYERQATTFGEKLQQRIPIAREQLPIDYGLAGGPRETNKLQAITSFNVKNAEQTPLQQYIYGLGVTKLREDKDLKGVKLGNEQLALLRKMSNDFLTPRLEQYVLRAEFRNATDAKKKVKLERYIDQLKRVPRQRFYNELRRTDPAMAQKFKNVILEKRGRPELMQ